MWPGLIRWDPACWDPFKDMEELSKRFNRLWGGSRLAGKAAGKP